VEARLVDALRGSGDSISLVAAIDNHVVGHILFTPVSIESSAGIRVAGLGPVAVRPECQRAGVGGRLVRAWMNVAGKDIRQSW
jgi:putative acetyltransferase